MEPARGAVGGGRGVSHPSPAPSGRGRMKTRPPDSVERRRSKHASEGVGRGYGGCIIAFKLHEGRFDFSLVRLPRPPAYRHRHKKKKKKIKLSLPSAFHQTSCSLTQQTAEKRQQKKPSVGKLRHGGPLTLLILLI